MFESGDLLIADPSLALDYHFSRSVILLSEVNESGCIGFVLNKPLHYRLSDLLPEVTSEYMIYSGGPVESDNLYFIHSLPDRIPNSVLIKDGIYWGGDFNELSERLAVGEIDSNRIRFFLGYSGWEFGQLQGEIDADSWVVASNGEKEKILQSPPKSMWKDQMTQLGGEFLLYANAPEDPRNN